ncbi:hypothetical protein SAMN04490248_1463 [Salinihabitans flavidus]|uniref:DUF5681 domain-containing protein n=1 Tax=Salinihabitans flavidus TaxID=569882 RepID=A0A1H8W6H4_9RHOB|nr:DUF5681 domain-containing protein [Salinihabitans flavidus]SEP23220.1 hypothetical protein SAMN04490248_1463 [Salinihabitans flavidus]
MSDDNDDYAIGKGKPPKAHQFKPGQSGNPNGRPKGSKNVHDVLSKILGEKITITDAGKKMVVDKFEGAMRVLVNKAFEGNPQSLKLLLDLKEHAGGTDQSPPENPFSDEDHEVLEKELDWLVEVRLADSPEASDGPE